ncbi:MAG: PAS domain S-box protein [Anaerolineae bacterium]|nr:PAS domain S-box protein [Anaerolineae bacterium]
MSNKSSMPLRILFLEDNPSDVILMLRSLRSSGFTPDWKVVQTGQEYEAQLGSDFDVILADYTLPDFDGLMALKILQERDLDIPFIVVTGNVGEEVAAECIKQGAADYLLKDRLDRLGDAVKRACQDKKLRDEKSAILSALRESEEKYRHLFEMESDALFLINNQTGQILEANAAASELYGYSRDELLQKKNTDLSAEPEETRKTVDTHTTRVPVRYHRKKDGTVFPAEITGRFLTWWGNEVHIAAVRDITERVKAEEALRREHALFDRIATTSPVGITMVDCEGQIIFANEQAEKVLGLSRCEITRRSYNASDWHITNYDGSPFPEEKLPLAQVIDTAQPVYDIRHAIQWPDGQSALLSINAAPLTDDSGNVTGMVATIEDITQRIAAEKALHRANRSYRMISDCSQTLIRVTDEQELLQEICRIIIDVGGFKMAWVGLAQMDEAKTVRPAAWAGDVEGYLDTAKITWDDSELGRGPAGTAIRTGTPYVAHDIMIHADYGPWREEAVRRGYASSISLPLLAEGQAFGALNIYAAERDTFDAEETLLLMGLADDLAYGIRTLQDRAEQSKAESALRESEERYRNLFDHSLSGIALHEVVTNKQGEPIDYVFLEVNPAFEKLTGLVPDQIVGKRVTEVLPGIEQDSFISIYGQVASTGVPTHFEEHASPLGRYYEVTAFAPFKGQFATIFTDVTERKQAEIASKKHLEIIRLLHEAGQQLTSTLNPEAVYHTIREVVSRVMDCDCVFISTYNNQDKTIFCVYAWYKDQLLDSSRFSPVPLDMEGHGIPNDVIRTGKPDIIHNLQERGKEAGTCHLIKQGRTARYPDQDSVDEEVMNSALIVPLRIDDQVVGAIQVLSRRPDAYSEDDLHFLEALAAQSAVARKNALLYQHAQVEIAERQRAEAAEREQRTLAEALRDTITALSNTSDTTMVMTRILENVGRVVPHDAANLMLVEGQSVVVDYLSKYPPHLEEILKEHSRPLTDFPIFEKMVDTGEPILVPITTQEPTYTQILDGWENSYVGAPIRVYGVTIGFLNLHSTSVEFFTPTHAERLQAFADQVALALENAQLYETLRHHADELKVRIEQRTAELRNAKEHVEAILNNSSDAILVLSKNGRIKQANPAFGDLFGHGGDRIYDKPLTSYVDRVYVDRLNKALQSVTKRHRAKRIEFVASRQDNGSTFDAELTLSPITSGDQASDIVCTLRDVTQRKKVEEELRKALEQERELGELKSRFVSVASHEFRTPLTTILSSASWLEVAGDQMETAKRLEHLRKIQTAAKNMNQLIEDVLTFSKAEAKHLTFTPSTVDLKAFVQGIIDEFKPLAGVTHTLVFKHTEHCNWVMMDERLFRLIISNLLSNAIKYSPDGGTVQIDLACQKGQIVLKVTDEGLGIPEKDRPYIYDAFHRATNVSVISGTGLGLSIAREAVAVCEGTITFDTQLGTGTTFTVTLPVQPMRKRP